MRIENKQNNINFKNLSSLQKPLGSFYNSNATIPTLLIETGVTLGRAYEANKRGGLPEASERLVEQGIGALVWIWGVQFFRNIGNFIGKNIPKIGDLNFDVGFDSLRDPIKNNKISDLKAGFKVGNILLSTAIATYFMGFILPKINHFITNKIVKKSSKNKDISTLKPISFDEFSKQASSKNNKIAFTSLINSSIALANTLENNQTARLLITDIGVVGGRFKNGRNKYERIEGLFRDIASIYFYLKFSKDVVNGLNKFNKNTDINPKALEALVEFLEKEMGDKSLTKENFESLFKANIKDEDIKKLEELFNKEEVISLDEFKKAFKNLDEKAFKMTDLQPVFEDKRFLSKMQAKDVLSTSIISDPKFLKDLMKKATNGASDDKMRFVSKKDLENIRVSLDKFIKQIWNEAGDKSINIDFVKKCAKSNINKNFLYNSVGLILSSFALGILIPKIQYFITQKLTKENEFPGLKEYK